MEFRELSLQMGDSEIAVLFHRSKYSAVFLMDIAGGDLYVAETNQLRS
jgi:hypothetical protein